MNYLAAYARSNLVIAGTGLLASIGLHKFFYDDRLWFTEHRIAPGTGVILMSLGIIVNRNLLRHHIESHDPRVEGSLDVLAVLSAITSFAVGVLAADLIREWSPHQDEQIVNNTN